MNWYMPQLTINNRVYSVVVESNHQCDIAGVGIGKRKANEFAPRSNHGDCAGVPVGRRQETTLSALCSRHAHRWEKHVRRESEAVRTRSSVTFDCGRERWRQTDGQTDTRAAEPAPPVPLRRRHTDRTFHRHKADPWPRAMVRLVSLRTGSLTPREGKRYTRPNPPPASHWDGQSTGNCNISLCFVVKSLKTENQP